MKTKLKIYYIVTWNNDCWHSFIQHQIDIWECYKLKEGYIRIPDYREDSKDDFYMCLDGDRKYCCFKWNNKKDIFIDLEKTKEYAIVKINEMYLSRCDHLIKERDEAIKKMINGDIDEE